MAGHNQQLRKHPLPSIEWLRDNLRYDRDTGELWWIKPRNNRPVGRAGCLDGTYSRWVISVASGLKGGMNLRRSRVAFALMGGRWPDIVDHINGNTLDDRWENLREVTARENSLNAKRSRKNTSGVRGVSWEKALDKWRSKIHVGVRQIHLGVYDDFFEAVCARKSAELKYSFHENHGR